MKFLAASLVLCVSGTASIVRTSDVQESQHLAATGSVVLQDIEQAIYILKSFDYFLIHGDWEITENTGLQHCLPRGGGPHVVEFGWEDKSRAPVIVELAETSEAFFTASACFVDLRSRNRIRFEPLRASDAEASSGFVPEALCDGTYSGVQSFSFAGGCWGPLITDITTSAWTKKCDKGNGQECNGEITFTNEQLPHKHPKWNCTANPVDPDRKAEGNTQQQTGYVHEANAGTC